MSSAFDFKKELFAPPATLSAEVESADPQTGRVVLNGVDARRPTAPFSIEWGDGTTAKSFFPVQHEYREPTRNYIVRVVAHYAGGATDETRVLVRFGPFSSIVRVPLPSDLAVSVPDHTTALTSRFPGFAPPPDLGFFDPSYFATLSRNAMEYVLTAASTIEADLVNGDPGFGPMGFRQVVLRDPSFGGGTSLWFTEPVALALGDALARPLD